ELGPLIAQYRAAYRAAGHPGPGRVFLRVPVYLAETAAAARDEPEASIMSFYRSLGGQLESSAAETGARAIEARATRGQRLQSVSYDEALREKVIVGTPDLVNRRLEDVCAQLELDGILAELNCGGQIPHTRVRRSLQLLCDEVALNFR
ncbi:MAG TPA: LLM class flavin-dependent oxidoreductase, partial [Dehalococcoidia bacterium]|nr:LLM class flavin-dependent oxidoreductase [Dehalococcoidia bacterium]